eukprot:CAMPEP_0180460870 /NCGR_PEP_ID=MMETSP1036_2-20121128/23586_1 /TAXON_ID=632150 /ORGANISM="Azadinium spinosum, Strain 3D9" /LENGTH=52 /DNA_ID=CAMNT_0022467573 /DNA_START=1549 /DNA_END=1704 /DNA_ORIENTATION=+
MGPSMATAAGRCYHSHAGPLLVVLLGLCGGQALASVQPAPSELQGAQRTAAG